MRGRKVSIGCRTSWVVNISFYGCLGGYILSIFISLHKIGPDISAIHAPTTTTGGTTRNQDTDPKNG